MRLQSSHAGSYGNLMHEEPLDMNHSACPLAVLPSLSRVTRSVCSSLLGLGD